MNTASRTCIGFFLTLFFSLPLFSQSNYRVITASGNSAVIQRPANAQFSVGDVFMAKRMINGRQVDVARVRVAILQANLVGFRIQEALADTKLQQGDLIVADSPAAAVSSDDLGFLDEMFGASTNNEPQPAASDAGNASSSSFQYVVNQLENEQPARSSEIQFGNSTQLDAPTTFGASTTVALQKRNFVGPFASLVLPVSSSSNLFSAGPQIGLHGIAYVNRFTNARLNFQLARLGAGSAVQPGLTAAGASRSTWMSVFTASVQPGIVNGFVLDLGAGYYRLLDRTKQSGRTSTAIRNAPGAVAGIGYTKLAGENSSLMLLATGNFYFLSAETGSFISFTASWLFGI